MKPLTREWIQKAEGDFAVLERESRVRKNPCYDSICFHAQQCAEKYLKAKLCETDIEFGKVHDHVALLEQYLPIEPSWESLRKDLAFLTQFSVIYRYPGESADKNMAILARDICRKFRSIVRLTLGLSSK